jgi:hypothetical protein
MACRTFLTETREFTSFRRKLMNLIRLRTWIRVTIQWIAGFQWMASKIPRAAEGVMTS